LTSGKYWTIIFWYSLESVGELPASWRLDFLRHGWVFNGWGSKDAPSVRVYPAVGHLRVRLVCHAPRELPCCGIKGDQVPWDDCSGALPDTSDGFWTSGPIGAVGGIDAVLDRRALGTTSG